jgi:hypothetical protein
LEPAASFIIEHTSIIKIAFASLDHYTSFNLGSFIDLVDTFIAVEYQAAP